MYQSCTHLVRSCKTGLSLKSTIDPAPLRGSEHPRSAVAGRPSPSQPRPKPFLAHRVHCQRPELARRHFWLGLVASSRCQAHALDRCSNRELIGALRRAGGGGQRGLGSCFSIANSFRLEAPEKISTGNYDLRGTHIPWPRSLRAETRETRETARRRDLTDRLASGWEVMHTRK